MLNVDQFEKLGFHDLHLLLSVLDHLYSDEPQNHPSYSDGQLIECSVPIVALSGIQ